MVVVLALMFAVGVFLIVWALGDWASEPTPMAPKPTTPDPMKRR